MNRTPSRLLFHLAIIFFLPYTGIAQPAVELINAVPLNSTAPDTTTPLTNEGCIHIACAISGAQVTINNRVLGTTPFSRCGFEDGFYTVEINQANHRPFIQTVQIEHHQSVSITAILEAVTTGSGFLSPTSTVNPQSVDKNTSANEAAPQNATTSFAPPAAAASTPNGSIHITCNTSNASVTVNKEPAGTAPCYIRHLVPGYYEVELQHVGFKPYRKMVRITGSDTVTLSVEMQCLLSRLIVTCSPPDAVLFINNNRAGTTPFDSSLIQPGTYTLRLEKNGYVPVKKTMLLTKGCTDTLSLPLVTTTFRDSVKHVYSTRSKHYRRIFFGLLSTGSLAGGLYFNWKAARHLDTELDAWNRYKEKELTAPEYSKRYTEYTSAKSKTDRTLKSRNALYILSMLGATGFSISILF